MELLKFGYHLRGTVIPMTRYLLDKIRKRYGMKVKKHEVVACREEGIITCSNVGR